MEKTLTSAQATYMPQTYKSFEGALESFLADQCPQIGGSMTRRMLVQGISNMVSKFYPETSHLKQGQIVWPTVHNIREWEMEHKTVLPRRGSIHDIGPTLTHKKVILYKLFVEQKSVQQTSRETYHSPDAIQRYISTFKQVLLCTQKGMITEQIAFATGRTKRLIGEYQQIIDEYKKGNYNMKRLLADEVHIENNIESWIIECAGRIEQHKN